MSFGPTHRSTDSGQVNVGRSSSVIQQAGVADRKGISIGSARMTSSFEGNITRVYKKLKNKRSESVVLKVFIQQSFFMNATINFYLIKFV